MILNFALSTGLLVNKVSLSDANVYNICIYRTKFIIREVNSDMTIYVNRTNAGKNQMPRAGFEPTTVTPRSHGRCSNHSAIEATTVRSGCRGFESRSGHLIFSSICSVYIDRHIRVDLSDDELCSKYAVLRTFVYMFLLAVIPAVIVVITVLAEPNSYGFHVMDKNNETL